MFPGGKLITDESPEDYDDDQRSLAQSSSIQEFRAQDETELIIDTIPSHRLKNPRTDNFILTYDEDERSEIVLDLREEVTERMEQSLLLPQGNQITEVQKFQP